MQKDEAEQSPKLQINGCSSFAIYYGTKLRISQLKSQDLGRIILVSAMDNTTKVSLIVKFSKSYYVWVEGQFPNNSICEYTFNQNEFAC